MKSTVNAFQEKMDAWIANMRDNWKETMSCQVTMEVCLDSKEPNPEDMQSEVEHREVPMEEAAVKSLRTMKKWHRGRHLAAGRRGEPKEPNQGDCGSWRKLAAACRKVSHHAAVAWQKGNVFRKIRTQGNCGSWKELAAARMNMTHRAGVARSKEHRCKGWNKDSVERGALKGREETVEWPGMQQWHKGLRPEIAFFSLDPHPPQIKLKQNSRMKLQ
jgi:hypothetical protein